MCGEPHRYTSPWKGNSWQRCRRMVDKYDEEMCDAWKEEVDKLLIFVSLNVTSSAHSNGFQAGLFSATITAFTVESFQWLKRDSEDATAELLAYLAAHLVKDAGPLPSELQFDSFQVST